MTRFDARAAPEVLNRISSARIILHARCGDGSLGAALASGGKTVHGLTSAAEADAARGRLSRVFEGDLDAGTLPSGLEGERYDALVVTSDGLDDAARLLNALGPLVVDGGSAVLVLPPRGALLPGHVALSREDARSVLRSAGFAPSAEDDAPSFARRAPVPLRAAERLETAAASVMPELLGPATVLSGRKVPAAEGKVVVAMITMNEEKAVEAVIDEIRAASPSAEILLVDSSKDRTAELATAKGAAVLKQFPPRGYGPAMMRVLHEGAARGDVVVTLDCDGTYPASRIPDLARLVLEEGYDVVNASRLAERPAAMPVANWAANLTFAVTTRLVHGLRVTDVHSGMRAYSSRVLREVKFFEKAAALPVELIIKPARLGYRVVEVPIEYRARIGETTLNRWDSTKWTFKRIFGALGEGQRVPSGTKR